MYTAKLSIFLYKIGVFTNFLWKGAQLNSILINKNEFFSILYCPNTESRTLNKVIWDQKCIYKQPYW